MRFLSRGKIIRDQRHTFSLDPEKSKKLKDLTKSIVLVNSKVDTSHALNYVHTCIHCPVKDLAFKINDNKVERRIWVATGKILQLKNWRVDILSNLYIAFL